MSKLDPQLEFLADDGVHQLEAMDAAPVEYARYGVQPQKKKRGAAAPPPAEVDILVQFDGDPAALEAAGMTVRTIAGDVVTGSIAIDRLPDLAEIAEVERVESSRALHAELDLATADSRVDGVQTGPPGFRGSGVIVGIVDSGIDYTHDSFRHPNGQTRILRIWDQLLTPAAGETRPAGFGYGVEYSAAQINAALATADPFQRVRHRDPDANRHGTHVTGIAAGDGSAPGQGQPAGTFAGVATEADIIVVGNVAGDAEGLGNSARALDAVSYIFQQATALGRPCVVNMSLGDNLGPHDGTALLERGIDNLLGGQGRVLVKSAGNAAADRIHAQGNVATGATVDVRFAQPANDNTTNQMDLWYEGADAFTVSVIDPAGNVAGPVAVGATTQVTLAGGNTVRVSHRNNDPNNGDKRVFLTFAPGGAGTMRAGNWTLRLTSVRSPSGGRFDAWIQRGAVIPQFLAPHESPDRTISTPGTANEVITAASHITRGAGVGGRSTFSSRGPTRDGRLAPTISAPGEWIISARGHAAAGQDPYVQLAGTSMASPHVAGAAALILQKTPTLTAAQVAQILRDNARTDAFTGATPNTAWGAGKLDLAGAFPPRFTQVSVLEPSCRVSVAGTPCVVSVIQATCRSVPLAGCPTVLQPECLKVQSVPIITCRQPVSVLCPSVAIRCQSIPLCVDPGAVNTVVNCGPVTGITTVVNPPVVGPAGRGPIGPLRQGEGAPTADGGTGNFATVFGPVCPSEVYWECPNTIPGVDCPSWQAAAPATSGEAPAAPGGPGSGLPACGFGVSSPRDCTWWSVPGVNCGGTRLPTIALDCPSVMPQDCLSRLVTFCPPLPSVPPRVCTTIPIRNCWAPTTAPGCDNPVSVLRCPSVVCTTLPTTVVNPTVFRDVAPAGDPSAPPADKGYYDYDESWWD